MKKITLCLNFKGPFAIRDLLNSEIEKLESAEIKASLLKLMKALLIPTLVHQLSPHGKKEVYSELLRLKMFFTGVLTNLDLTIAQLEEVAEVDSPEDEKEPDVIVPSLNNLTLREEAPNFTASFNHHFEKLQA